MNDPTEMARVAYEQIADAYADRYLQDLSDAHLVERFAKSLSPGSTVLDAGCGPGTYTNLLTEMGFDVTGIDVSPSMLEIARRAFPKCKFAPGDMRALDTADASIDGVLSAYSLIHVPNAMFIETLRELGRVLRPGGKLCIIGQQGEPDHVENDPLDASLEVFVNFFQEKSLRNFALAAGFEVTECETHVSLDSKSMAEKTIFVIATKPAD